MFVEIEDSIIARIQQEFGNHLRAIESHPGRWDSETLKEVASKLPGVFVVLGDAGAVPNDYEGQLIPGWNIYIAVAHANGQAARRRGDGRMIGAYEIVERLIMALHAAPLHGDASLSFNRMRNLFSFNHQRQGVAVYEVRFTMTPLALSLDNATSLDDFNTYHADHVADDPDGPVAVDEVTLEQNP